MNGLAKRFLLWLLKPVIQEVIDSEENQDGISEAIENELAEGKFQKESA